MFFWGPHSFAYGSVKLFRVRKEKSSRCDKVQNMYREQNIGYHSLKNNLELFLYSLL